MTYGGSYYQPQRGRRRRISGRTLAKLLAFTIAEIIRNLIS